MRSEKELSRRKRLRTLEKVEGEVITKQVEKKIKSKSNSKESLKLKKVVVNIGGKVVVKKDQVDAVAKYTLKHKTTKYKGYKVAGVLEKCGNGIAKKTKSVKTESVGKVIDQTFAEKK